MLIAIYGIVFLWQIFWLVQAFRLRKGWGKLAILEAVSIAAAFGCMWYFDTLPGYGTIPGWAYFPEVFYSLCAGCVYLLTGLITLALWLFRKL